jgi:hypothetical protein
LLSDIPPASTPIRDGIALARMLLGEIDVHLFLPLGVKSKMAKLQLQRYENFGGKYSHNKTINFFIIYSFLFYNTA